ncbi:MAG TPA: hypothetical protein VI479_10490, partial [Blastocatellia bacterium]
MICTPWFGEQGLPVWIERVAGIIALMMLFGLAGGAGTRVRAQGSARLNSSNATNIITDRLTDKDLRRW